MKAVYIKEFGDIENLEIRQVEKPPPPQGKEVLVSVRAAALNRADLLQRLGKYPAPKGYPPNIPGLEFAGTVEEVGAQATEFKGGDRVFGITAGGAQAEFLLTDSTIVAKIPDCLSFIEAAAIPEAFITAHDAIFTNGKLQAGETLLIHAAASGVGLAALQLAKACGASVIGTSRTPAKLERCREFGLDHAVAMNDSAAINEIKSSDDFADSIKNLTDGRGADVILDLVGAKYLAANIKSLASKGRIVFVGTTGGARGELDISQIMSKRAQLFGTVLRSRSLEEKALATEKFVSEVVPLFESGQIKPNIDRIFKAAEVQAAHRYLESNKSFGKVILEF